MSIDDISTAEKSRSNSDRSGSSADRRRDLENKLLAPYFALQSEALSRGVSLVVFAQHLEDQLGGVKPVTTNPRTPKNDDLIRNSKALAEVLRAAVVLTHAYLEDYLRTIAEALLPEGNENALNAIPLVGIGDRPEKFLLGKLVHHRNKRVAEVLRESVRAHLSQKTFNNKGEILKVLDAIGLEAPKDPALLDTIQEMIQRRHQIVHRADKLKGKNSETPTLQSISSADALRWLQAAQRFMYHLDAPLLEKLAELQEASFD